MDLDGSAALVAKIDPAKVDAAREVGQACADVTDGDRCEAAIKILKCLHETAVAKGLKEAHWVIWSFQNQNYGCHHQFHPRYGVHSSGNKKFENLNKIKWKKQNFFICHSFQSLG